MGEQEADHVAVARRVEVDGGDDRVLLGRREVDDAPSAEFDEGLDGENVGGTDGGLQRRVGLSVEGKERNLIFFGLTDYLLTTTTTFVADDICDRCSG